MCPLQKCAFQTDSQLTPDSNLNNTAAISFMKHELLLKERIKSSARRCSLCLREALLPTDQVDFHPRGRQHLASCLALQPSSPNHLDLEVSSLITHAQLDITKDRTTKDLSSHQLAWTQALNELRQLALA